MCLRGYACADSALEAGAGRFVVVQRLNLCGARFGEGRLGAEDIELGSGTGIGASAGQAEGFISLLEHLLLGFEDFAIGAASFCRAKTGSFRSLFSGHQRVCRS